MKRWWIGKIVKMLLMIVIAAFAIGFIVMSLWNLLIPELFRGPVLTYWQAIGLLFLSHILLRGWGPWHHASGWRHDRWRKRFEERMAGMTPEEREKITEEWKNGSCRHHGESRTHHKEEGTK